MAYHMWSDVVMIEGTAAYYSADIWCDLTSMNAVTMPMFVLKQCGIGSPNTTNLEIDTLGDHFVMLVLKYGIMLSSMGIAATHFELIIAALDGKVIISNRIWLTWVRLKIVTFFLQFRMSKYLYQLFF